MKVGECVHLRTRPRQGENREQETWDRGRGTVNEMFCPQVDTDTYTCHLLRRRDVCDLHRYLGRDREDILWVL
jgi:hypothetical protein